MGERDIDFLVELEQVVRDRLANGDESSYTKRLAMAGDRRIAQKVGEEAVELALAAIAGSRGEALDEAADLLYHLLVLLNRRDIRLADVAATLAARHRE